MYQRPDGLYERKITVDGKRVAIRGKSEREVNRKIKDARSNREESKRLGRPFEAVAEEWKAEHWPTLQRNTLRGYNAAFDRAVDWWGNWRVGDIEPKEIEARLKDFAAQLMGQKTVNTQAMVVRMIFAHAVVAGDIMISPATEVRTPKGAPRSEIVLPSDEDMQTVVDNIGHPFGLFPLVIMCTGTRPGEARALRGKDLDFGAESIHIGSSIYYDTARRPQLKVPKTRAGYRSIYMVPMLQQYLPRNLAKDQYLFADADGQLPNEGRAETLVRQYRRETGLVCPMKDLRHAYATILYDAGVGEKDAQVLLGHRDITTTRNIYTHISKRRMTKTRQLLSGVFRPDGIVIDGVTVASQ